MRRLPKHKRHLILTGHFVPGLPFRTAYSWAWFKGAERRDRAKGGTNG